MVIFQNFRGFVKFCANILILVEYLGYQNFWLRPYLVVEFIRNQYGDVNGLISNVKKVFFKTHFRVQTFREALPDCPLPPEPVPTRWGSWIEAAIYYCFILTI